MSKLLFLILISLTSSKYPIEKNVVILTDSTFEKALNEYENLMVLFYAPWCGHCKKFHPEYEKAALSLKKENIILAKVDAESNKKLSKKYNIESYPTIKAFIKKKEYTYDGERNEESVIDFMRKYSAPVLTIINNKEDAEKFFKKNEVTIVYFGNDKDSIIEFESSGRLNREIPFVQIENEDVINKLNGKKDSIVIIKSNEDNKRIEFENDINEEEINDFIDLYAGPNIYYWDEKGIKVVFHKNKPALFFFADPEDKKYDDYENLLNKIHPKIFTDVKIVLLNNKEGEEKRISDYIGVNDTDLPCVKIIHSYDFRVRKYSLKKEINEENIINFVSEFKKGNLIPELKSEEEPKENNGTIFYIVGKSFKKNVMNSTKDFFIKIYAPWCSHCKELEPIFKKLAEDLKNNKNLVFAESDGTKNEFDEFDVFGYPSLVFIPGNKKNESDFVVFPEEEERNYDNLLNFVKKHSTFPINIQKKDESKSDL